jgi:hypothetical protein
MPAKLDSLRITECPAAFVDIARKHNALVDMIARAIGTGGVQVKVSDLNFVVDGSGVSGNGNSAITGNLISVVSSNGTLQNVYNDGTTGTSYPTAGKWATGSGNVAISNTGFTVFGTSGNVFLGFSDISRNLYIRTISVCNSGTVQNMDIIASAPY